MTIRSRWRAILVKRLAELALARRRVAYWAAGCKTAKTAADRARAKEMHRLRLKELRAAEDAVLFARRVLRRHPEIRGVSPAGVNFIKQFEGFYAHQYDDGVGVKTIGYGTTAADVNPLPTHLTEAQAAALLEHKLDTKYAPPVMKALAPLHPTQNMIDAGVSFAYNLGEGSFRGAPGFETLTRALKARDARAVADAFLLYDNPHDPAVHAGLRRRRQAERALFLKR